MLSQKATHVKLCRRSVDVDDSKECSFVDTQAKYPFHSETFNYHWVTMSRSLRYCGSLYGLRLATAFAALFKIALELVACLAGPEG